jgi:transcriptional regulator with XRE-family HTH domain
MDILDLITSAAGFCKLKRRRRGLSVREAATQIGVQYTTLYRMEHGTSVSVETLVLVIAWLYDGKTPQVRRPK